MEASEGVVTTGSSSIASLLERRQFHPYLSSLGLGACLASWSVYLMSPLYKSSFLLLLDVSSLATTAGECFVLLFAMLVPASMTSLRQSGLALLGIGLSAVAGSFLALFGTSIGFSLAGSLIAAGLLLGISLTLILLAWVELLSSLPTRTSVLCLGMSMLLSSLFSIVNISVGSVASAMLVFMLPVISLVILAIMTKSLPVSAGSKESTNTSSISTEFPGLVTMGRLLLLIGLYSFLVGTSQGRGLLYSHSQPGTVLVEFVTRAAPPIGKAVGAFLILAGIKRQDGIGVTFRREVAVPLVLAALFISSFLDGIWISVYTSLNEVARQFVICFLWIFVSEWAKRKDKPGVVIFAQVYLCFLVSHTLGILGAATSAHIALLRPYYSFLLLAVLFALIWLEFGPLLMGKAQGPSISAEKSDSTDMVSADVFAWRCEQVMRQFSLTPRECDIFPLLARGHTLAHIARVSSIGRETVKTHVQSVYRKIGVHSKEELIRLVETTEVGEVTSENDAEDTPHLNGCSRVSPSRS